jgi:hypothetical protein
MRSPRSAATTSCAYWNGKIVRDQSNLDVRLRNWEDSDLPWGEPKRPPGR